MWSRWLLRYARFVYEPRHSLDQRGALRSSNARGPPRTSSEEKTVARAFSLTSRSVFSSPTTASAIGRSVSRTATGLFSPICSARAEGAVQRFPGSGEHIDRSQTFRTTSIEWAPRQRQFARDVDGERTSGTKGTTCHSQKLPATSGSPNVAVVEAATRSHAITTSKPHPSTRLSTAAITGFATRRWVLPTWPPRSVEKRLSRPRAEVRAG